MRRIFIYIAAVALAVGLSGAVTPASAATRNPGNSFEWNYLINVRQVCIGIAKDGDAHIYDCTYKNDQAWYRRGEIDHSGYYQLVNAKGKCLSVAGRGRARGAQVIAGKCLGTKHHEQYWHLDFLSMETYACYVFNYKSTYVLEPDGVRVGSLIKQQPWRDHDEKQEWVFEINSDAP